MTITAQVEDMADDTLNQAYRTIANRALWVFRDQLAIHNLDRHKVEVRRLHGEPALYVGEHIWFELRGGHPLTDKLIEIGGIIDKAHNTWAGKLVGLNLGGGTE